MKKRGHPAESKRGLCPDCDFSEENERALGSAIGAVRHRHYLAFQSAELLHSHLKSVTAKQGDGGYSHAEWIASVVAWYRLKKRLDAQATRLREAAYQPRDTLIAGFQAVLNAKSGQSSLDRAGVVIDAEFSEYVREREPGEEG